MRVGTAAATAARIAPAINVVERMTSLRDKVMVQMMIKVAVVCSYSTTGKSSSVSNPC